MKPEDIDKQYKKFLTEINKEAAEVIKKAKADKTTYKVLYTDRYKFFNVKTLSVEFDNNSSIEDVIESVREFEDEIKNHKCKLDFQYGFEAEGCGYAEDTSVEFAGMKAQWYEPREKDCNQFEAAAQTSTRAWISNEIKKHRNITGTQSFSADCKIVELFKAGKIDFDTLCDITLTNCKL